LDHKTVAARGVTRRRKNLKQWDLAQRPLQKKKNTGSQFYLGIF
jgi:hypothetical protein